MNDNFKLIRKLKWEEVFLFWYESEGEEAKWKSLAEERGYSSWAEWRLSCYADPFKLNDADWALYEISRSPETVAKFYAGPFKIWIERYFEGAKTKTFAELAERDNIINHPSIKSLVKNYPDKLILICLEMTDGRIFTIEGSHRSCALAILAKENKAPDKKLIIALGKSKLSELPVRASAM